MPVNSDGHGYKSQQLESDKYRVSFAGNEKTDRDTVHNYLLYRAAELTLANGGDYFVVVNRSTQKDVDQNTTVVGSPFFSPFSFGTGFGGTATTYTSSEYEAYGVIVIEEGNKPSDNPVAYDARQVKQNLQSLIKRPES